MANINSTASHQDKQEALAHELHAISARLAGVQEILHEMVESPDGRGNSLHLMAAVVADANEQISLAADRVSNLGEQP